MKWTARDEQDWRECGEIAQRHAKDAMTDWPTVGDRVTYTTKTARRGWLETVTGEGIVTAEGCGICSFFTVDGYHIHPKLGDTWAKTGDNRDEV